MVIDILNDNLITISSTVSESDSQVGQVEKYSSIIDKFGPSVAILAVFIVLLFISILSILKIVNDNNKNNEKNNEMIREQNIKNNEQLRLQQEALVNKILETSKEQKLTPVKEPNIFETFIKIDGSTKDILERISKNIKSDRLSVYVFHNGSHSSHGLPFFKTTCVSEFIKKNCGINNRAMDHNCLPLSVIDTSLHEIHRNGKLVCHHIKDIKDNFPVLYNMMSEVGIETATGVAIYDKNNRVLGILVAEYITDNSENIEDITKELIEETTCLSPVLEYSDFQSLRSDDGRKDN